MAVFSGKSWDSDLGLYWMGVRLYDPVTGQFVSRDALEQYWNTYSYTGGSPLDMADPWGLETVGNDQSWASNNGGNLTGEAVVYGITCVDPAMLNASLEAWRIFLHPTQRKIVERDWNGPVRVLGGAGTGKTVVAMHRAKWLVENRFVLPNQKILFTTYTKNLADDIRENFGMHRKMLCSTLH